MKVKYDEYLDGDMSKKQIFEVGQQSRQVEIDELKKRINEATKLLSLIYEDSGWLDSIELRDVISKLKGKEND